MATPPEIDELRVILDAIPTPIFYKDVVGRYLGCNRAFETFLGKARNEIVGKDVHGLSPKDLADIYKAADDSLFASGGTQIYESRVRYADGTYHDVVFHKATFADAAGKLAGLVGTMLDVSSRKEAQDALRLFRALVDESNDTFEILDPSTGRFLDVNQRGCTEHGYTREEYLCLSVGDIDPTVDTRQFPELAEKLGKIPSLTREGIHRRNDGSTFPVEVSLRFVRFDRAYVVAVVRNITDRKRGQKELGRLATAIEHADEMVLITGRDGLIEFVNPAFERVTGYSQAESLGRNPRLLKSGLQDEDFYRGLWANLGEGRTWRGRMINKKKDGTLYTQDSSISPVRDARGATTSYVAVMRDVSANLALEAEFLQSQKMEAVGRLAGGIAHDFNNALCVILSYSQMICAEMEPGAPFRDDLEEIRRAGLRAASLTKQLLAFSRRQVLEPEVLDLNQNLAQLERMVGQLIGADVALTIDPAHGLWSVKVDPGQFEQVVMNLAVNARDAMPQGGGLAIETRNVVVGESGPGPFPDVPPGQYVGVAVRDTGVGMDEETMARIFEPFFTTKEKGKGTGLGLATVFGIVQQSGGHIRVASQRGKGTTFKIYLPRFAGAPNVRPPSGAMPIVSRGGTETILLVEDDEAVRILARGILRSAGYLVLEAPNGGEALLICEQHPAMIHLLLTDVVLPRMSGHLLSERLVALQPEMRVLFMSGYTDDTVLLHGVSESTVAFLPKPFTPTTLLQKVRGVLDLLGVGPSAQ